MAWKFFSASGAEKVTPAVVQGSQWDYAQITADVSVGAGNTNEGNALAVITGNAATFDGSKVKIEFSCERLDNGGHQPTLGIYRDGTCIADFGPFSSASQMPVKLELFDTPSAGSHTYAVKIWDTGAITGGVVKAGAGGAGNVAPAFLRVTRADPQVVVFTQYVPIIGTALLKKTTAKTVNTSVAETDLLNGEITIPVLKADSVVRFTAWGDCLFNDGGSQGPPRFKLKLGATTIFDTGASGIVGEGSARAPWKVTVVIINEGATNAQSAYIVLEQSLNWNGSSGTGGRSSWTTPTTEAISNIQSKTSAPGALSIEEAHNTAAVDTTVTNALVWSVINPVSNANYETKLFGALVEIL